MRVITNINVTIKIGTAVKQKKCTRIISENTGSAYYEDLYASSEYKLNKSC